MVCVCVCACMYVYVCVLFSKIFFSLFVCYGRVWCVCVWHLVYYECDMGLLCVCVCMYACMCVRVFSGR